MITPTSRTHFEFLGLCLDMFDQTYINAGSKTQNVEELSLDLIFHNNSKQNSKLRIHSRPDRNESTNSVLCVAWL